VTVSLSESQAPALLDVGQEAHLSLREVFCQHGRFVVRSVRRMGVREADVEDVAQEVFIVLHRRLRDYNGKTPIRSWIFGIIFRVVSEYRRRWRVRREYITEHPPEPSTTSTEAELRSQLTLLEGALSKLDDGQRSVFVLYELEGMKMRDISTALEIPLFTAYTRLRKARKVILRELRPELPKGGRP
jgi:RNA polymerase sigma-70 factor (ECF subfamily)